jgi:hypothetical protein
MASKARSRCQRIALFFGGDGGDDAVDRRPDGKDATATAASAANVGRFPTGALMFRINGEWNSGKSESLFAADPLQEISQLLAGLG